jgi:hypothetical protein
MTEAVRQKTWSILRAAFETILRTLQVDVSSATLTMNHSYNEAFLFRAYAEYSSRGTVIVISFDVQMIGDQIMISGDIADERGLILNNVIDASIASTDCEIGVIRNAEEFASRCMGEIGLLKSNLNDHDE